MAEQTALPPYNEHALCPKCESRDIYTGYRDRVRPMSHLWPHDIGEHLERGCRRCGWRWAERPRDWKASNG